VSTEDALRRLNWGCGAAGVPGWINADLKQGPGIEISGDIRDGLPLDSDSIDYAVAIHALPEVPYTDLVDVLRELRRVLKSGGTLRISVPNVERAFDAYRRGDREFFSIPDEDAATIGAKLVTHLVWYGYTRSLFTKDFMEELLRRAGFETIHRCRFQWTKSEYEEIVSLDDREGESLFVEAVK
jgi:predicted SAM-dependent methyltransferase